MLFLVLINPLDNLRGIAHGNTVGRDVPDDDGTGTDDAAVTDGDARTDGDIATYPAAFADSYGTAHLPLVTVIGIERMLCGVDMDSGGYECLTSYIYATSVEDDASEIDKDTFSCKDEIAIVAMEGRFDKDIWC